MHEPLRNLYPAPIQTDLAIRNFLQNLAITNETPLAPGPSYNAVRLDLTPSSERKYDVCKLADVRTPL